MVPVSSTRSAPCPSAPLADEEAREVRVIGAHRDDGYLRELWQYRALIYQMARRDLRLRHAQTLLGLGWPIVQPLLSMLVLTFVFGRVAKLTPTSAVPYPVLVLSGLLPWQLFATGLTSVGLSLLLANELIDRVYFPRLVLPIRALAVALHNALITCLLLLAVMLAYGVTPSARIVWLLPALLASALLALGLGCFLSIWNAVYRDFLHLLPFLLQLAMYVSPVGFETHAIPPSYAWVSALNPLAAVIDACRYALLPNAPPLDPQACLRSALLIALCLGAGIMFFRRHEGDVVERL
jgi:lipopolysaccharide transport system permease protein